MSESPEEEKGYGRSACTEFVSAPSKRLVSLVSSCTKSPHELVAILPGSRGHRRLAQMLRPLTIATPRGAFTQDPFTPSPRSIGQATPAMAFPAQDREPAPTLPSIIAPSSGRYRGHHVMPFGRSPAISIPGLELRDDVPPPLPRPRVLPVGDAPQQSEGMRKDHREYSRASSSFASGYGSVASSHADERRNVERRDTGGTTNGDEGYYSFASTERYDARRDSLSSAFV